MGHMWHVYNYICQMHMYTWIYVTSSYKHVYSMYLCVYIRDTLMNTTSSLLQNIVSFIGLFCKRYLRFVCICLTYVTHSWIRHPQLYVYVIYIHVYTLDLWDIRMWHAHVYDFSFTRTCYMCMRIHVTYIHIYTHIHMRII